MIHFFCCSPQVVEYLIYLVFLACHYWEALTSRGSSLEPQRQAAEKTGNGVCLF